jgi:sugar/nucleoside kinase (ribokinase family)
MFDLFLAADLCMDVILQGNTRPQFHQVEQLIDDYTLELGGSGTITAGQFAKLGGNVGIMAVVGDDPFGHFCKSRLRELNVDTSRVWTDPRQKTGVGFALVEPEDRAILTYLGTIDALKPQDFTDDLKTISRHWHVAGYFLMQRLRGFWPEWLRGLKKQGVTLSLDTNWSPDGNWNDVKELLPLVDIFLPNDAEAKAITGKPDVEQAGRALAAYGCLAVITCGKDGAIAFQGDKVWKSAPDPTPIQFVDATGAGDCFDAGFVRAWQLGWPVEKCLEMGVRCGRANVQAAGGFAGQLRENLK